MKKVVIDNRREEVSKVSCFIEKIGESLNISSETCMSVDVAVTEIVSTIIQTAYPEEGGNYIQLKVEIDPEVVLMRIVYEGMPLDLSNNLKETATQTEQSYGTGNFLIYRIMDEVIYQEGDNRHQLILKKRRDAAAKPNATLKTNICRIEDVIVLAIEGRLDTVNASVFHSAIQPLLKEKSPIVIMNCVDMTYISSFGLRNFLILQKYIQKSGGNLVIEGVKPEIRHIFEIMGCTSLFTIL